ncbi:small acid-soluble spore protein L (minor) [Bacillus pakistanensis]|uniref:Small acid-soluble spore protein L (Minor) n=1 Tax=Rossellomorea pakistanensis TaxID=992288 RepID=A0ABS2N8V1_9BACI|nr:small, acid-soluble spore protein L [Bacillus pakistanensis]MBM7584279.1 small acid-soluble spore protein L (minor) [Bacillus pakistanensis]
MSEQNKRNRGSKKYSGMTPQGDTEFAAEPKSKLENAAKKANKK